MPDRIHPASHAHDARTEKGPGGLKLLISLAFLLRRCSVSRVTPRISDSGVDVNSGRSGLGEGRGHLVGDRQWSAPDHLLEIGQGERPRLAGRIAPAEIGQLPARITAKFRADPLRSKSLVTPQAAPLEPSFHAVAIAQVRRSK